MTLNAGTRLGPYEIIGTIGAGGMGEVYRACDTKLGRDIALKILREQFALDADRLARFQREAQLLASLNHPNIAAIYGLEEADGVGALVLELVEGPTLVDHIAQGAIPIDEALPIARQIADALEAAHEHGIIHRDLKPANIKLRPDGTVKVLDFGLAKSLAPDAASATAGGPSQSPTITTPAATRTGVILGTAAYMSPEQARGRPLDKRTDIWAFGCVLYEMLTGQRAFPGETVSEALAKVLEREPDWSALPAGTSPRMQELLRRCLQKDPRYRLQHIGDARIEIEETIKSPFTRGSVPSEPTQVRLRAPWPQLLVSGFGGLLVGTIAAAWTVATLWRASPAPRAVTLFAIHVPPNEPLATGPGPSVAISPDGMRIAYVVEREGEKRLLLRAIDQLEAIPVTGSEGASAPFFSPDSQSLGFFAKAKVITVPIAGGSPLGFADALVTRGAAWGPDDTLILSPTLGLGLARVSIPGGAPQTLTRVDVRRGERAHRWPQILPGGKVMLFTIAMGDGSDDSRVAVESLETGERRILIDGGTFARYAFSGHLLYFEGASLFAVPFDPSLLELTGDPVSVLEGVMTEPVSGAAHFSFSDTGSVVYVPAVVQQSGYRLQWVDHTGASRALTEMVRAYVTPRFSPDGDRLAVAVEGPEWHIWIYELARGTLTRLTFEGSNSAPIWTPDGKRVTFSSTRAGPLNIFWTPADGSAPAERLLTSEHSQVASSWSPDGRVLAFHEVHPATGADIWMMPVEGHREPRPFLRTSFSEWGAKFSPDGRWVAYVSDESGRDEIYMRPARGQGSKTQISTEGGVEPVWAPDSRQLFYRNGGGKLMSVTVKAGPTSSVTEPVLFLQERYEPSPVPAVANYDVAPNGQGFVMAKKEARAPTELRVVLSWFDQLGRRAPKRGRE